MKAYLGLGSNIGDGQQNILNALERLAFTSGLRVLRRSSLYTTKPWGKEDQRPFVNAVAEVEVDVSITPHELLRLVKGIEIEMGRVPSERWGPRLIDIDILLFGDYEINSQDLTIPHKYMLERAFVMVPLAELIPDENLFGRTVGDRARQFDPLQVQLLEE